MLLSTTSSCACEMDVSQRGDREDRHEDRSRSLTPCFSRMILLVQRLEHDVGSRRDTQSSAGSDVAVQREREPLDRDRGVGEPLKLLALAPLGYRCRRAAKSPHPPRRPSFVRGLRSARRDTSTTSRRPNLAKVTPQRFVSVAGEQATASIIARSAFFVVTRG